MQIKNRGNLPQCDDSALQRYLAQINKFPILAPDEEYMLAKRYQDHNDIDAAHKLVSSHLRLVAKIAMKYRGYGLPMGEVISEGNIGLMQAVKKFEPDRGLRLATYAIWWIKASIQEYVLRSWSLVKIGTTINQKKLFFNLRKLKSKINAFEDNALQEEQINYIADKLHVTSQDVILMNQRMSGDKSLNMQLKEGDGESGAQWQDLLHDEDIGQEARLIESSEYSYQLKLLNEAIAQLNPREATILRDRRLQENPKTLEELSQQFGISRERVRQIEVKAYEKVQDMIRHKLLQ